MKKVLLLLAYFGTLAWTQGIWDEFEQIPTVEIESKNDAIRDSIDSEDEIAEDKEDNVQALSEDFGDTTNIYNPDIIEGDSSAQEAIETSVVENEEVPISIDDRSQEPENELQRVEEARRRSMERYNRGGRPPAPDPESIPKAFMVDSVPVNEDLRTYQSQILDIPVDELQTQGPRLSLAQLQKPEAYKSPKKAAFLSLLIPGSGQFYVGGTFNLARGVFYFASEIGLGALSYHYLLREADREKNDMKIYTQIILI
jgi:TM2 domain-containing membrane protein YozV